MSTTDTRHTPKSLRARLGLSVKEVAERANVAERTVSYFEAGRDVTTTNAISLAVALEVPLETLMEAWGVERERRAAEKGDDAEAGAA